jgi:hypothetical protein
LTMLSEKSFTLVRLLFPDTTLLMVSPSSDSSGPLPESLRLLDLYALFFPPVFFRFVIPLCQANSFSSV